MRGRFESTYSEEIDGLLNKMNEEIAAAIEENQEEQKCLERNIEP